jgi:hypothetical protein
MSFADMIFGLIFIFAAYEQNLVDAKSEINFLAGAMEDMRQSEESKRASLEFRIDSLENQNDVMRKYHDAELENVRNELSQVTMEKNRLLHQLRESEKTNASLMLASSSSGGLESSGGEIDLESECAKLRIENAHLLAMAADDKTRAERRLREMVAAQSASNEADIILEQELRVKAESTADALQAELDTLRRQRSPTNRSNLAFRNSNSATSKENESLKSKIASMKAENDALRARMEDAAVRAKSKIESLSDDYEKLQVKVSRIEREGKRDMAIQAEIARMREESSIFPTTTMKSPSEILDRDTSYYSSSAGEAFDHLQEQKRAIEEERKLYKEMLTEQDELFALLAQRDVQLSCLRDALLEAAGDEAVEQASKKAQEETVSKYGNFIEVVETE